MGEDIAEDMAEHLAEAMVEANGRRRQSSAPPVSSSCSCLSAPVFLPRSFCPGLSAPVFLPWSLWPRLSVVVLRSESPDKDLQGTMALAHDSTTAIGTLTPTSRRLSRHLSNYLSRHPPATASSCLCNHIRSIIGDVSRLFGEYLGHYCRHETPLVLAKTSPKHPFTPTIIPAHDIAQGASSSPTRLATNSVSSSGQGSPLRVSTP